jgi:hypothetical protein
VALVESSPLQAAWASMGTAAKHAIMGKRGMTSSLSRGFGGLFY